MTIRFTEHIYTEESDDAPLLTLINYLLGVAMRNTIKLVCIFAIINIILSCKDNNSMNPDDDNPGEPKISVHIIDTDGNLLQDVGIHFYADFDTITITKGLQQWNNLLDSEYVNTDFKLWHTESNVDDHVQELPDEYALRGNFPNPFSFATTILYDLPRQENINMVIMNC